MKISLLILLALSFSSRQLFARDRVILLAMSMNYATAKKIEQRRQNGKSMVWEDVLSNTIGIINENTGTLHETQKLVVYLNDIEVPEEAVKFLSEKFGSKVTFIPTPGDMSKITLPLCDAAYLTHPEDIRLEVVVTTMVNLKDRAREIHVDTFLDRFVRVYGNQDFKTTTITKGLPYRMPHRDEINEDDRYFEAAVLRESKRYSFQNPVNNFETAIERQIETMSCPYSSIF